MDNVVRDVVSNAVYTSLVRICGGGVKDEEKEDSKEYQQEKWLKELKQLAYSSVSFPNGGANIYVGDATDDGKRGGCEGVKGDAVGVRGKPHDVEVRAALSFYHRYKPKRRGVVCDDVFGKDEKRGQCRKRRRRNRGSSSRLMENDIGGAGQRNNDDALSQIPSEATLPDDATALEVVSDMGLERQIDSPQTLAILLARTMEEGYNLTGERYATDSPILMEGKEEGKSPDQPKDSDKENMPDLAYYLSGEIRSSVSGVICIVTRWRAAMLRDAGRLPCPLCIKWCKGEKGLWWHQQQEHGSDHSTATASASAEVNCLAIIPYRPPRDHTNGDRCMENTTITCTDKAVSGAVDDRKSQKSPTFTPDLTTETIPGSATKALASFQKDSVMLVDKFELVKKGDLNGLVAAVRMGYDPKGDLDKNKASPLHWAAGCGHLHVVKYLIESCHMSKEDPQQGKRSYRGRTPLHWAARNGHLHVVEYLVDISMANLNATTGDGTTAFCWACWQGHLSVMKFLYSRGCNPNILNSFGCNAVLWSAQGEGSVKTMQWLMSIKCNFSLVNSNGHGILHKAAQRGKDDVCRWFLSFSSLDGFINGEDLASECAPRHISKRLALVSPDSDGCCPSDLAGMEGHATLAEYMAKQECRIALQFYQQARKCSTKNELTKTKINVAMIGSDTFCSTTSSEQHQVEEILCVPIWLERVLVDKKHISAKTTHMNDFWETGGGVWRMASQILAASESNL